MDELKPSGIRGSGRWLWIVLALALVQSVLLAHAIVDKSETIDEWRYLHRSVQQWQGERFYCSPVLPHWAFAAALHAAGDPQATSATVASESGVLQRNLVAGRTATALVVVAGGILLWAALRRFGEPAAILAYGLWCFSPGLLAHGALITFDGWVAAACAGALWAMLRWWESPTMWQSSVLGLALAAATASKLVALGLLLPVVLGSVLLMRPRPCGISWLGILLTGSLVFFLALWALYGFGVETLDTRDLCGRGRESSWLPGLSVPLPLAPLWESILIQVEHGYRWGQMNYLFGETGREGWWWFFLACIALQTTVGVQGLAALRVVLLAARPTRSAIRLNAVLLSFPLLLLLLLSAGKTQRGLQYLLPAYPFVFAFIAGVMSTGPKAFGKRIYYMTVVLAAAAVIESIRVHPHHLMFYNIWAGGPTRGPFYLITSNDMGQDKRRLAQWQAQHGIEELYYLPYGGHTARYWGVEYRQPTECRPLPGVYALHAATVHRPHPAMRGCLDWLTQEPPDERIGYSIYIYFVDDARIKRLASAVDSEPFLRTAPPANE